MPGLVALDPGLLATVQDLGRRGHAALGVARCGAADPLSLVLANRLVGNPDGAPALELTLTGGAWRFEEDTLVALAGAPMPAVLTPERGPATDVAWAAATRAHAGSVLRLGASAWGARAYLAVAGGLDVPRVLGSAATHVASGLGGVGGRPVARGQTLAVEAPARPPRALALSAAARAEVESWLRAPSLRATDGAHAERFEAHARAAFWDAGHVVSAASDRMGVRLSAAEVTPPAGGRLTSEGLPVGAIQVPEHGQAIALLVDAPPTGGYPVVACVAAADLPRLGQARPHEQVRFERVAVEAARAAHAERARRLAALAAPA